MKTNISTFKILDLSHLYTCVIILQDIWLEEELCHKVCYFYFNRLSKVSALNLYPHFPTTMSVLDYQTFKLVLNLYLKKTLPSDYNNILWAQSWGDLPAIDVVWIKMASDNLGFVVGSLYSPSWEWALLFRDHLISIQIFVSSCLPGPSGRRQWTEYMADCHLRNITGLRWQ